MPKTLSRRSFLTYFPISWVTICVTLIVSACRRLASPVTPAEPPKSPTVIPRHTRSDGFTSIGNLADLQRVGQISYQRVDYQKVLVIRQSPNSPIMAFDPTCPHQGCVVRWVPEERLFGCPCHAGEFNGQGQPTSGPPTAALPQYQTKIEHDQVWVLLPGNISG
jgi:cytochrome b6-f complex iron-sulfur subunit